MLKKNILRPLLKIIRRVKKGDDYIFREIAYIFFARLFSVAFFFVTRNTWLVAERLGMSAEENGYAFFKYCLEQHPEKEVYYVINRNSVVPSCCPDRSRIIRRGGIKNFIFLFKAECVFFTNDPRDCLVIRTDWMLKKVKTVFLRHGVGLYSNGKYLQRMAKKFDVVCCVSEREKQILARTCKLENSDNLLLLGQPRLDDLYRVKNPGSYIMVCPTWRYGLAKKGINSIVDSDFLGNIFALLENEELQTMLEAHDIKIHFRMHFNMMHLLSDIPPPRNVIFEDERSCLMKDSLMNAKLLITDYSSIMWDMAFMRRPVILYQFDREAFLSERSKSKFNLDDDELFCPVATDVAGVVGHIKTYLQSGFVLNLDESEKVDGFFLSSDENNCKRIFKSAINVCRT